MTHPRLTILIGPPGTGKTSAVVGLPPDHPNPHGLIGIIEQALRDGIRPDRIAYLAFSKKAATEAIERTCLKFGFTPDDLPYFRTIHSLAFRQLGLRPGRVMQWQNYRDLGNKLGMDIGNRRSLDDDMYGMGPGDRMLFLEGLARVQQRPLQKVWEDANEADISYGELDRLAKSLALYKDNNSLVDYTDMLRDFVARGNKAAPELDILIVDESQDNSRLAWSAIDLLGSKAKRVYVAGDPDQAVFAWAGADVETFMGLQGEVRTLAQSFRVPAKIHATADRIIRRVSKRRPTEWEPRAEQGSERWYYDAEQVDLSEGPTWKEKRAQNPNAIEWLLLARNGYMLRQLEDTCLQQGFSFTSVSKNPLESPALKAIITYERMRKNIPATKAEATAMLKFATLRHISQEKRDGVKKLSEKGTVVLTNGTESPIWWKALDKISAADRDFFIAARKRGETLTKTPRIRISTIHCAKGSEAENVLLLTDMSQRTFAEMERNPDTEHRVNYVAVTRAKQSIHYIQPRTTNFYEI